MHRRCFTLALGLGAILLTARPLPAETAAGVCAERGLLLRRLAEIYGESRQAIGLAGPGQVVEVFASAETGTWTITVTLPTGEACLVAAGEHFERLDEPLPPPGDPT